MENYTGCHGPWLVPIFITDLWGIGACPGQVATRNPAYAVPIYKK